jgi:hypothetical protein
MAELCLFTSAAITNMKICSFLRLFQPRQSDAQPATFAGRYNVARVESWHKEKSPYYHVMGRAPSRLSPLDPFLQSASDEDLGKWAADANPDFSSYFAGVPPDRG